ncbi:2546_t:CDS:2 [Acaulospora colombiana]|uniref:2546_t:CDS:1 n=1 Tax=Acaulospora colombiana TaxID=27376 RepID=A0ACA9L9B2_9GLOM|nr:2546_t:CDS:2 [Acaulospora colombiana]
MSLYNNLKELIKNTVEFKYDSFENIGSIPSSSNIRKAYLRGPDKNVVIKYLRQNKYRNEEEYYEYFIREAQNA